MNGIESRKCVLLSNRGVYMYVYCRLHEFLARVFAPNTRMRNTWLQYPVLPRTTYLCCTESCQKRELLSVFGQGFWSSIRSRTLFGLRMLD